MHRSTRTPALLALFSLLVSLLVLLPAGTASAAESIPPLQWPAPTIGRLDGSPVTSTNGDITLPCSTTDTGSDLTTYNASGQVVRQISRTSVIDGVTNCLRAPIADKNGDIYGVPYGKIANNNWAKGPNLLAYNGNTLKWKYPLVCGYDTSPSYAVGANGNIYSTTRLDDGVHLIGLTPGVAAGQTAPTKVLDVKISNDCSMMLRTYKDGIVLHGQSSGNAWYYSYSGKFLGQASIGDVWGEKLNAEGQLFVASYVPGSGFRSISISRYDPTTGSVKWTVSASQPQADTNGVQLLPTPGGGVVALTTEQHMVSDGVPSSPKTWEKRLVTINASGQKVRSILLPDTYANGTFGGAYLTAESGGKVIVTRELNVNTGLSYPTTVPGTLVRAYDPANDTWPYDQAILGDPNKSGGPYGYALDFSDQSKTSFAVNNTVYVAAHCSGNCGSITWKLFPLTVNGVGKGYPEGDVLTANTPAQPAPVPYAALGDSYSSGEGVPPFESASNTTTDQCHRSELAYAKLVSRSPKVNATLVTGKFAACSGAKTEHVQLTPTPPNPPLFNTEPLQVSKLDANTKVVTITIGGNDIGFSDFGKACYNNSVGCNIGSPAYNTALGHINNDLPTALVNTYKKILDTAPAAQIYVLDYPQVAPIKTASDPMDARCAYLFTSGFGQPAWADAQAARDIVAKLDAKISTVITNVRGMNADYSARLHYVPVNAAGSPFTGHTVCSDPGESYFLNIDQGVNDGAYEPFPT